MYPPARAGARPASASAPAHGEAAGQIERWQQIAPLVIDLSADFRLDDAAAYTNHYHQPHTSASLLSTFTYGLTEWNGARVSESQCVANPGCFATAIGLALAPLANAGALPPQVTVFAATGSTGSGHHGSESATVRAIRPAKSGSLAAEGVVVMAVPPS